MRACTPLVRCVLLLLLVHVLPALGDGDVAGPVLLAPRPYHGHHGAHGTAPAAAPAAEDSSVAAASGGGGGSSDGRASAAVVHVLEVVAFTSSMILNLSPMPVARRMARDGTVGNTRFANFFCLLLNSTCGLMYGVAMANYPYAASRLLNVVLAVYYVYMFWKHANTDDAMAEMVAWGRVTAVVGALSYIVIGHLLPSWYLPKALGVVSTFTSLLSSSASLLNMASMVRRRDASEIPCGFNLANALTCIVWGAYALAIQDSFIMTQNVVSFVLALLSLALLHLLPGNKSVRSTNVVRVSQPATDVEAAPLLNGDVA